MKKLIAILMCAALLLSLAACSAQASEAPAEPTAEAEPAAAPEAAENAQTTGGKTLVVYFSATNNTEAVANTIAAAMNADIFEIIPSQPYTSDDLNWRDGDSRVSREHDDESLRTVALESTAVDDWEDYDTVFVGYPIWWGIAAWPVSSFVAANDFTGKTVIPFCTSSSSDLGESGQLLAAAAGTGTWLEGQRFRSGVSEADVQAWLDGLDLPAPEPAPANETAEASGASVVYFTSDISAEGMMRVYEALGVELQGDNIAVKLSTGEPPASNYLHPELIKDVVEAVNGTIVECNTAYGGSRSETAMHYQVAEDHGFTELGKGFVIMDEDGSMILPVEGGQRLTENYVGAHFGDFDGFLVLSHFKGHMIAGYGGALKNISIGIASQEGKNLIHTAGRSHTSWFGGEQDAFLESMADAGKSVVDALDHNILFINVMNRLSIDCDCNGNPAEPDIHDIGILASTDPVALDQACMDLIYQAEGNESFVRRVEGQNGLHVLEAAETIGLGSRTYELVDIDA